jgi:orotate phosphoribosyltransferase-like protein
LRTIQELLSEAKDLTDNLPEMAVKMTAEEFTVSIAGATYSVKRDPKESEAADEDELPDDVEEQFPGP